MGWIHFERIDKDMITHLFLTWLERVIIISSRTLFLDCQGAPTNILDVSIFIYVYVYIIGHCSRSYLAQIFSGLWCNTSSESIAMN